MKGEGLTVSKGKESVLLKEVGKRIGLGKMSMSSLLDIFALFCLQLF